MHVQCSSALALLEIERIQSQARIVVARLIKLLTKRLERAATKSCAVGTSSKLFLLVVGQSEATSSERLVPVGEGLYCGL
jgi:hypothetical protein